MIDFLLAVPGKLTTIYSHLTTYLSSTRCAKIDNLDAAISTRAAASTALSSAMWTDARAGYLEKLNATAGIPGTFKSVQRGTISLNTETSLTATITSVVLAKSIIIVLGSVNTLMRVELTNATTVTAYKASGSSADTVGYVVVEFY